MRQLLFFRVLGCLLLTTALADASSAAEQENAYEPNAQITTAIGNSIFLISVRRLDADYLGASSLTISCIKRCVDPPLFSEEVSGEIQGIQIAPIVLDGIGIQTIWTTSERKRILIHRVAPNSITKVLDEFSYWSPVRVDIGASVLGLLIDNRTDGEIIADYEAGKDPGRFISGDVWVWNGERYERMSDKP